MNIDQTQRLLVHLYCAAISGQRMQPLAAFDESGQPLPSPCPHWELPDRKMNRYVPLLIWGEAGVGKSETVRAVAEHLGIGFIDLRLGQLDAGDLVGLPREEMVYPCVYDHEAGAPGHILGLRFSRGQLLRYILQNHPDQAKGRSAGQVLDTAVKKAESPLYKHLIDFRLVYSTPGWFPSPGTHGFLFLDEISRSGTDIRNAVFQLVLDRKIHMLELPPGWIIVAANNPPGMDYAGVEEERDKAFRSRFLHIALDPTVEEWLEYAYETGVDPTIRSLMRRETGAQMLGLKPVPMEDSFPTPRTWVMLNNIMPGLDRDLVQEVASGLVGPEAAAAWSALRMLPTEPVSGREIVTAYAVLEDGRPAPSTVRDRVYSFLDYPTQEHVRDASGDLQYDADGNPVTRTVRSRRTDVLSMTMDGMTEILQNPMLVRGPGDDGHDPQTLRPFEIENVVAFLSDAFRVDDEVGSSMPALAQRPGMGISDIAMTYLRFWSVEPTMGAVVAQSRGLLHDALQRAGAVAKSAQSRSKSYRRRLRRPKKRYGELPADAEIFQRPGVAAFSFQDW